MKKAILVLIAFCAIFIITGCGKQTSDLKLKVVATTWSGESPGKAPEEEFTYDIVLDKEYVVKEGGLGLTFTITKINDDSIVIETTDSFSYDDSGLTTTKKKFTVKKGETLKLETPTMDAGGIYYLSLE